MTAAKNLSATSDRVEAARLALYGNWNIERGAMDADSVLAEMVDAQLLVLIYTPQLYARGLNGVRLTADGHRWLALVDQETAQ